MKQIIALIGFVLLLVGMPVSISAILLYLVALIHHQPETIMIGIMALMLTLLLLGTGGTLLWHSASSLQGRSSTTVSLLSTGKIISGLGIYLFIGAIIFNNDTMAYLFFPIMAILVATLSSLIAISWFMGGRSGKLTWRQGSVAFLSSATTGLFIGGTLQFLLMLAITPLFSGGPGLLLQMMQDIPRQGYINLFSSGSAGSYLFFQLTVIYPLISELVKPLTLIPLIPTISRRDLFLLGAIAGAGYAAVESALLIGLGHQFWIWVLILQLLGCAIHPLCSGLVALGWRQILTNKLNGRMSWFAYFGAATALRVLWNCGFLATILIINSESADVTSAIAKSLASFGGAILLTGLGVIGLWSGYLIAHEKRFRSYEAIVLQIKDQAIAVWAIASLIVISLTGVVSVLLLYP
jgi:hypothetical protein